MDLAKVSTSIVTLVLVILLGGGVAFWAGDGGAKLLNLPLVTLCAALAFVLQWLAYVPAFLRRTEKFYDLVGSVTYLSVVALALLTTALQGVATVRSYILAAAVAVWAIRLGSFLFARVKRVGRDDRFVAIKQSWHRFLVAWTLQGLWVFLTLIAVLLMIARPSAAPVTAWDIVGGALWVLGFGIEIVADRQKAAFAKQDKHQGQFITAGLWSWSRHPNYAGEILLWAGLFLVGLPNYRGAEWLAVASPLFVWLLLRFISGVPILEQRADARWGGQSAYEDYKSRTSLLWLRPPRR